MSIVYTSHFSRSLKLTGNAIFLIWLLFLFSFLKHLANYMVKQSMDWAMIRLNLQKYRELFMTTASSTSLPFCYYWIWCRFFLLKKKEFIGCLSISTFSCWNCSCIALLNKKGSETKRFSTSGGWFCCFYSLDTVNFGIGWEFLDSYFLLILLFEYCRNGWESGNMGSGKPARS